MSVDIYRQGGKEYDREGKQHVIERTRCLSCDAVLSEMHIYCCGYSACGFQPSPFSEPHKCRLG